MAASSNDWSLDRSRSAQSEGWGLFIVDGELRLQRDDEARVFPDDDQALAFVHQKAEAGSPLHRLALELHQQPLNPDDPIPVSPEPRRSRRRAHSQA